MFMKRHILAALQEEFDQWEKVLAGLSEAQVSLPHLGHFSVKDVLAHLHAWQQISVARLDAALHPREPEFPAWMSDLPADWEDEADQTNTRIYELNRDRPWPSVREEWRACFRQLIELGEVIPEPALLDSNRYPWLNGYSLADVLLGTYDHHHEHLEKLLHWLSERGDLQSHDDPLSDSERITS